MNTPRTDAALHPFRQRNDTTYESLVQHARQLKTEVQELRAALERAMAEEDSGFGISDETIEKFRSLLAKVPK